jgi:hypothetical protein
MNGETLLLRQAHPTFVQDGKITSQVFMPFPKDNGHLSVYDGDKISANAAFEHYTKSLGHASGSVWGVTCDESANAGLSCQSSPLENFPEHAHIDFSGKSDKECRKLAKKLKDCALARNRLHP